jgi:hypothetical protein
LIQTMLHPQWPILHESSAAAGELAAEDIRRRLNATVDAIRHHYHTCPTQPLPADFPAPEAARTTTPEVVSGPIQDRSRRPGELAQGNGRGKLDVMRFLTGQAPASEAVKQAPSLGDGSRGGPPGLGGGRFPRTRPRRTDRGRD